MGCEPRPLSSIGPRRGATSRARAGCKFVLSTLLATIALFAASTVSTHAQTNWTGQFSSNWFLSGNWDAGFPRQTTDANINTVTPNSTAITSPGALARNLSVGPSGTGMLTILTGGTLADSLGTVGNLPGGAGHGDGDRSGLQLVECRKRRGRRPGHGHSYNPRRRHGETVAAAQSDCLPARLAR